MKSGAMSFIVSWRRAGWRGLVACLPLMALVSGRAVGGEASLATLTPPTTVLYCGGEGHSAALADLNADGHLDLLVTAGSTLSVRFGYGDGMFGPRQTYAVGSYAVQVALFRSAVDTALHVAVANGGEKFITLFTVGVDGTLQDRRNVYIPVYGPEAVAFGDLDGDGREDMVVAASGSLYNLLQGVDGSFGSPVAFPLQDNLVPAYAVALADFNEDGRLDAVAAGRTDNGPIVFMSGDGVGGFGARSVVTTGNHAGQLAATDLNRDGHLDLVVTYAGSTTPAGQVPCETCYKVSVLLGRGNGTFQSKVDLAVRQGADPLNVADMDGDGIPDLLLSYYTGRGSFTPGIFFYRGRGDGSFDTGRLISGSRVEFNVAVGDINGDGRLDIISAAGSGVYALVADGAGSWRPETGMITGEGLSCGAVGDLDGDGVSELVLVQSAADRVLVRRVNDNVTFRGGPVLSTGPSPTAPLLTDLDGDSTLDLVVANSAGGTVSVFRGRGDGDLAARTDIAVGATPLFVMTADLDRDDHADLLVVNAGSGTVSVLPGRGDATFGARTDYAVGAEPRSCAVARLNADVWPDLVVANSGSNSVSILAGGPGGELAPAVPRMVGVRPSSVVLADFHLDGHADMAVALAGEDRVVVFPGDGAGNFGAPGYFPVGHEPARLIAMSLAGYGAPDLVTANAGDSTITVLLCRGDATFSPGTSFVTGRGPAWVAPGRWNADTRPDLAVFNAGEQTYTILLNSTPFNPGTVTLFQVTREGGTALITWEVLGGAQQYSYRLFRQARAGAERTLLAPDVFVGQTAYEYRTAARDSVLYWLEETNLVGRVKFFGPITDGELVPVTVSFSAALEWGRVVLHWSLPEEARLNSYRLYREDTAGNRAPIGPDRFSGATEYEYADPGAPAGEVTYWLQEIGRSGIATWYGPVKVSPQAPARLDLAPNWPNPVRGSTSILFQLPAAGWVRLGVFDARGRLVVQLLDETRPAGTHLLTWDGRAGGGALLAAGVYFLRLEDGRAGISRKIVLTR